MKKDIFNLDLVDLVIWISVLILFVVDMFIQLSKIFWIIAIILLIGSFCIKIRKLIIGVKSWNVKNVDKE